MDKERRWRHVVLAGAHALVAIIGSGKVARGMVLLPYTGGEPFQDFDTFPYLEAQIEGQAYSNPASSTLTFGVPKMVGDEPFNVFSKWPELWQIRLSRMCVFKLEDGKHPSRDVDGTVGHFDSFDPDRDRA